jgi:HK97 family phage portal protein
MANPILAWLRGEDFKSPPMGKLEQPTQPIEQRKMYYYNDVGAAIRLGTLVHGPGASELIYQAWHHDDSNSAVFACLSAICTAYPEAPAKVWLEPEPGQREWQQDHPLQSLLDKPNPYLTREQLWHYVQWCKHVNGNAYLRKIRAGAGNVTELWPISPLRVQPITTREDAARGRFISYYAYTFDPAKDPLHIPPEDMVHFKLGLDDRDHRLGLAPLARLVDEVMGDDEASRWQTTMLGNGGSIGMLVEVPPDSTLTPEQAETLKADMQERFGGKNRGRVGVLMGGAKASPYGFSPEQMDMKALHRIPEERIAAVLRVPAIIAGLGAGLDRSTYANFREAREMFAEMTILPLYAFDASSINQQLLPEFTSDPRLRVAFDITDMRALQEDEDNKWKRLNEAVKTGWVDVSEARTDVGLPPDMPEVEQELPPPQPLPGQPPLAALPPGSKSREIVLKARDLEHLPELLQALVDLSEPGLERSLERYFDGQRRRVKRALVG